MVNLPKGNEPIELKLVFKRKLKFNGIIDKYNARFVVQGYWWVYFTHEFYIILTWLVTRSYEYWMLLMCLLGLWYRFGEMVLINAKWEEKWRGLNFVNYSVNTQHFCCTSRWRFKKAKVQLDVIRNQKEWNMMKIFL